MSILLKIMEISLEVERSHCMQDRTILARELEISDVDLISEPMRLFSKDNPHTVQHNVVRPFILNFGKYFRYETQLGRWPTIGEVSMFLKVNFENYVHPSTLLKLTTDYRLRKVASEISGWAESMNSRVGTLPVSERLGLPCVKEILQGYTEYLHTRVYGRELTSVEDRILALHREVLGLKFLLQNVVVDK